MIKLGFIPTLGGMTVFTFFTIQAFVFITKLVAGITILFAVLVIGILILFVALVASDRLMLVFQLEFRVLVVIELGHCPAGG